MKLTISYQNIQSPETIVCKKAKEKKKLVRNGNSVTQSIIIIEIALSSTQWCCSAHKLKRPNYFCFSHWNKMKHKIVTKYSMKISFIRRSREREIEWATETKVNSFRNGFDYFDLQVKKRFWWWSWWWWRTKLSKNK